jgi:hypothetical protein
MGWVFSRPSLIALEVLWRWLVGVPLLALGWAQAQVILAGLPPESAGLTGISFQNPWIAAVQASAAWARYLPHVAAVLRWLAPLAGLAWIVVSGIGRSLVLKRMEPRVRVRPLALIALQAVWLAAFFAIVWGWYRSIGWAAAVNMPAGAEPDLIDYSIVAIFLSLGFFTLWALVSWPVAIAPVIALQEDCPPWIALGRSLRLGRVFTGKLVEVNLVMGIVKLALLVVAMVFSSVLIPFSQEVGTDALHLEWVVVLIVYFIASDFFHVVRMKSYVEFWRMFRGPG